MSCGTDLTTIRALRLAKHSRNEVTILSLVGQDTVYGGGQYVVFVLARQRSSHNITKCIEYEL